MKRWFALLIFLGVYSAGADTSVKNSTATGVLKRVWSNYERMLVEVLQDNGEMVKFVCEAPQCNAIAAGKFIDHRVRVALGNVRNPLYADGVPQAAISVTESSSTTGKSNITKSIQASSELHGAVNLQKEVPIDLHMLKHAGDLTVDSALSLKFYVPQVVSRISVATPLEVGNLWA